MGFINFSKKNKSDVRSLSENEIQKKLYGEFEPDLKSYPETKKEKHRVRPIPPAKTEMDDSAERGRRDLFEGSNGSFDASVNAKPELQRPNISEEHKKEQARIQKLEKLAAREEKPRPKEATTSSRAFGFGRFDVVAGSALRAARQVGQVFTFALTWALGWGVKILFGVGMFLVRILRAAFDTFDLKKPGVRRAVYWTLGFLFLASVFFAVHLLNVRREVAMKTSKPRQPAAVARRIPPAPIAETFPLTQVEADEIATEISGGATVRLTEPSAVVPDSSSHTSAKGPYVIQIATFVGPQDAEKLVESLKTGGWEDAFARSLTRPSGRVYYYVFVGGFDSFTRAQQGLEKFRKTDSFKSFPDAFVRKLD